MNHETHELTGGRGRVTVLNGPSSVGKTTIAAALRELLGVRCAVVGIDQFYPSIHPERKNDWELFQSLTSVVFQAARAFARSDFDVVVDTVFERRACVEICNESLDGLDTCLVGLVCPVSVLEERERRRGDRPLGLSRRQSECVHASCSYDFTMDTSTYHARECAELIVKQLSTTQGTRCGRLHAER